MNYSKTYYHYLSGFCDDKFGAEKGKEIFLTAEKKLGELVCEADYKNNKYMQWHMDKTMLPVIAIYLTLKETEDFGDNALEITDEMMQINRLEGQKKNKKMGKIPFSYYAFKGFCKSIVTKQQPIEGWDIDWIERSNKEIHFNMTRCIYVEITKKYNCFELCQLFCKNDDVILAGYSPKIIFERKGTIARGQDHCDFHFINGKLNKAQKD